MTEVVRPIALGLLAVLAITHFTMATPTLIDTLKFFNKTNNASNVMWKHAANTVKELTGALNNPKIHMIQGDITMGKVKGSKEEQPIMSHNGGTSDLSLQQFVDKVVANGKKGMKLDFKTTAVFEKSQTILMNLRQKAKVPVWLNADIFQGSNNATTKTVDPNVFVDKVMTNFPEATLSVGWTTSYGDTTNTGKYTVDQVKQMVDHLKVKKVKNPHVTFGLRAGLAVNNIRMIQRLLRHAKSEVELATITIWSPAGDPLDNNELQKLIDWIGISKVYLDIPPDVRSTLRLNGAIGIAAHWMLILASIFATLAITRVLSSND